MTNYAQLSRWVRLTRGAKCGILKGILGEQGSFFHEGEQKMIYLDNSATTQVWPEVADLVREVLGELAPPEA